MTYVLLEVEDLRTAFESKSIEYHRHVAFLCRHCGQVWARLTNKDDQLAEWSTEVRACPKCFEHAKERWWEIPGSIVVHKEDIENFPPEVLKRELILTRRKLTCFSTD